MAAPHPRRRDPRREPGRRPEQGLAETERREQLPGDEPVERLARRPAHHLTQQDRVQVAVDDARAGGNPGRLREDPAHQRRAVGEYLELVVRDVGAQPGGVREQLAHRDPRRSGPGELGDVGRDRRVELAGTDRKSTRLNSSHVRISYAVFCLKKKTKPRSVPCAASCASRIMIGYMSTSPWKAYPTSLKDPAAGQAPDR